MKINFKELLVLIFLSLTFLLPRLYQLGFDVINIDYPLWDNRATNFYVYLKSHNFAETYRTSHPGVTVMWLAGGAVESFSRIYKGNFGEDPFLNDFTLFQYRSFAIKVTLVFAIYITYFFSAFLLQKIFSKKVIGIFLFLLSVEPYLFAHDRLFHLDGLLSAFMFLGLVSSLLYFKENKFRWVVLGAFASALAFLTKVTGLFSALFFLLLVGLGGICHSGKTTVASRIRIVMSFLLLFIVFSILLFPSAWVDPLGTFTRILRESFSTSDAGHNQYYLGSWMDNPGIFYYPLVFIFKSSPVMLLGTLFLIFGLRRDRLKKSGAIPIDLNRGCPEVILVFLYITLFLLEITLSSKKVPRYILPLFPAVLLVISYYFCNFLALARRHKNHSLRSEPCFFGFRQKCRLSQLHKGVIVIVFIILILQIATILKTNPINYLAYTNPIVGGMKTADFFIGNKHFGFGLKDVAEYLNQKPYAKEIKLAFDGDGSIAPFFIGMSRNSQYIYRDGITNIDYFLLPYYLTGKDEMYLEYKNYFEVEKIFAVNNYPYWYLFHNKGIISNK